MPIKIEILSPANNTNFDISAGSAAIGPQMPTINAEARIVGITPDPTPTTRFTWTVEIRFQTSDCQPNVRRSVTINDRFELVSTGGRVNITFPRVRGGQLTLTVSAVLQNAPFSSQTSGLRIRGTNPMRAELICRKRAEAEPLRRLKMPSRTARSRMRTRVFYRTLGVCVVFMSCLVMTAEARISVRARFIYFYTCGGKILKLNIRTRRVIYRRDFSMLDGIPSGVVDGCVSTSLRFDAKRGLLYGVFPKEARVTEDGTRHYRIIVFRLPQLKIIGAIEIDQPLESPPALLVSEDGRRLLVSYLISDGEQPSGAQSTGVIATYDTGNLKVIESLRQPAAKDHGRGVDGPVYFSEDAYLGEDGRTIYDRDRIITITSQAATLRSLDPDRILDHIPSPQLRSLEARDASTGKRYLPVKYADSAAGHALLFGASTPGVGDVFFTVDLNNYRTSAIIKGPLVTSSTLHLTPNAKQAVVEEIERQRKNGEDRQISKTGRVLVYDMASGRQIRQFKNAQLSDPISRLLSITPDGATLFFAVADGLLAVSPARGLAERPKKVAFPVDQWTRGVLADR